MGSQAYHRFPAKVLPRRGPSAARSLVTPGSEIHPRALGSQPLGTRHRDAHVRVQCEPARSAAGNFGRSGAESAGEIGSEIGNLHTPGLMARNNAGFERFNLE